MTCEEFRRRWLDDEPTPDAGRNAKVHPASCVACRAWIEAERALDDALGAALVVAPPPELSARLARIPALAVAPNGVPVTGTPWDLLVEAVLVLAIGLATIGFGSLIDLPLASMLIDRANGLLQTLPLILNPPLLSYVQSLAVTMTEAMATLLLLAIALSRLAQPEGSARLMG